MMGQFRDRMRGGIVRRLVAVAAGLPMLIGPWWTGRAQTVPQQETPNSTYTLHVYTDLLQVPTIVLTRLHSNYRSLTAQNFTLSLDDGPRFHPANVRLEGDDTITLAVLFDLTTDDSSVFSAIAQAMTTLPPGVLSARDYISVYVYDCQLMRTTRDKPATPEELRASMVRAMTEGAERARNGVKRSCSSSKKLYDVVGAVGQDIGDLPGRRVILVVSDGTDRRSDRDWLDVVRFAGSRSIAVFGIRPIGSAPSFSHGINGTGFNEGWLTTEESDSFGKICAGTGGVLLDGDGSKKLMIGQIQRLMTILRNRYIIEFPRPVNGSVGYYGLDVQTKDPSAIVRPAGAAFPPRERDVKPAEGTLPEDESKMPVVGAKHQDQPK